MTSAFEAWVREKLAEVRALRALQPLWREQCAREEAVLVELLRGFCGDFAAGVRHLLTRHLSRSALEEEARFLQRLAAFQSPSHAGAPAPEKTAGATAAQLTWDFEQGTISLPIVGAAMPVGPHIAASSPVAAPEASGAPSAGAASATASGTGAVPPDALDELIPFVREALRRRDWERRAVRQGVPPDRVRQEAGCLRLLLDAYDRLQGAELAPGADHRKGGNLEP